LPRLQQRIGSNESGSAKERRKVEEFKVRKEDVVAKVKGLVREGNVRRIVVRNDKGRTLLELPLTVGVIGTLLVPVAAAVGAIAALVADLTLAVERREPDAGEGDLPRPAPAGEDERKGEDPLA
jgi:hypothetical protein